MGAAGWLLGLLSLAGCPDDPRENGVVPPVAVVGETPIERAELFAALSRAGVPRLVDDEARDRVGRHVLRSLIDEHLIDQAAQAAGVTVDEGAVRRAMGRTAAGYPTGALERTLLAEQSTLEDYRARLRRRLRADRWLKAELGAAMQVGEDEVRARYDATVAKERRPAQVRARQVLVKTEEEAKHILREIWSRRMRLEEAARRYSEAPEGEQGGDLGWFAQGQLPPVFDHCFSLPVGQVSEAIGSDYGFHLFEVIGTRPGGVPRRFADARDEVWAELRREKEAIAMTALLQRLRSATPTRIDDDAYRAALASIPPAPVPVVTDGGPAAAEHEGHTHGRAQGVDGTPHPATHARPVSGGIP